MQGILWFVVGNFGWKLAILNCQKIYFTLIYKGLVELDLELILIILVNCVGIWCNLWGGVGVRNFSGEMIIGWITSFDFWTDSESGIHQWIWRYHINSINVNYPRPTGIHHKTGNLKWIKIVNYAIPENPCYCWTKLTFTLFAEV